MALQAVAPLRFTTLVLPLTLSEKCATDGVGANRTLEIDTEKSKANGGGEEERPLPPDKWFVMVGLVMSAIVTELVKEFGEKSCAGKKKKGKTSKEEKERLSQLKKAEKHRQRMIKSQKIIADSVSHWAQCSKCNKWRRVPTCPGSEDVWTCEQNVTDSAHNACEKPQEEDGQEEITLGAGAGTGKGKGKRGQEGAGVGIGMGMGVVREKKRGRKGKGSKTKASPSSANRFKEDRFKQEGSIALPGSKAVSTRSGRKLAGNSRLASLSLT